MIGVLIIVGRYRGITYMMQDGYQLTIFRFDGCLVRCVFFGRELLLFGFDNNFIGVFLNTIDEVGTLGLRYGYRYIATIIGRGGLAQGIFIPGYIP